MKRVELAPSILAADFSRLGEQIKQVEEESGRLHVDVMDGHFVPNLSMGPQVVEAIRACTDLPIEVHLMVAQPEKFIDPFVKAGAQRIVFHQEVVPEPLELIERITSLDATAGIAINPASELDVSQDALQNIDLIIVMTVNPGFGGQAFMEAVLPKLARIESHIKDLELSLEVDGGIDRFSAPLARKAGANVFVAGNAVFKTEDPRRAAREILASIDQRA